MRETRETVCAAAIGSTIRFRVSELFPAVLTDVVEASPRPARNELGGVLGLNRPVAVKGGRLDHVTRALIT